MNLPNDYSRCDGLLPKQTQLHGKPHLLWSIDCPKRETCARYMQVFRDSPTRQYSFIGHMHAPGEYCPDYIHES